MKKLPRLTTEGHILKWCCGYLADFGEGPKHVSGDCISKVSASAGRNIGGAQIEDGGLENVGSANLYEDVAPHPDDPRVEQFGSPVAKLPRLRPKNM